MLLVGLLMPPPHPILVLSAVAVLWQAANSDQGLRSDDDLLITCSRRWQKFPYPGCCCCCCQGLRQTRAPQAARIVRKQPVNAKTLIAHSRGFAVFLSVAHRVICH